MKSAAARVRVVRREGEPLYIGDARFDPYPSGTCSGCCLWSQPTYGCAIPVVDKNCGANLESFLPGNEAARAFVIALKLEGKV